MTNNNNSTAKRFWTQCEQSESAERRGKENLCQTEKLLPSDGNAFSESNANYAIVSKESDGLLLSW